jgi:hypothetical protein
MPIIESMSCAVPAMVVNYSAMEDHAKMPGGIPINVGRYFYEAVIETEQRRALPDNKHFGEQLNRIVKMKPGQREELARRTHNYIVEPAEVFGQTEKLPRFGYDRTAAIWMNVIDSIGALDRSKTWDRKEPNYRIPDLKAPNRVMSNTEFVRWAITSIMRRPDLATSFMANEWIRWLNCGFKIEGNQRVPCDRNTIANMAIQIVNEYNSAEKMRADSLVARNNDEIGFTVL